MIGRLDHFGLHVSMEPFENEVVLINEYSLPSRSMLEQRLKQMFEFSDYSDELCFLEIIWFLIYVLFVKGKMSIRNMII